jgi:hypothetical protein
MADESWLIDFRFNRIGNREMYMNCAVVDITNKKLGKRDSQAAAASALTKYPDMFVANLASINSCRTQETADVIFDSPGKQVVFDNGDNASMKPSFNKGQCTGKGSKSAGSKDTSSSNSGGQWTPPAQSAPQQNQGQNGASGTNCNDGFWHAECYGGSPQKSEQQSSQAASPPPPPPQQKPSRPAVKKPKYPNTKVQQQLDAYLATLYGRSVERRNTVPADEYTQGYNHGDEYETQPVKHVHTENCKHKPTSYPDSHYSNPEDLDPNPEDGIDYSNEQEYNYDATDDQDSDSIYKRTTRQKRWTSYSKRADGTLTPMQFHRGDDSPVYQQASAQTYTDPTPAKDYYQMTPAEQFEAFLRRMVELSNNVASLIKYAAASTVKIPYYPPASTYESTTASAQPTETVTPVLARRGVLSLINSPLPQVYPGPSVGTISPPGDATDSSEGFEAWFPDLVQESMMKRQLVDPVTSQASRDAGDGVGPNNFESFLEKILRAFSTVFSIFNDEPAVDPVPTFEPETTVAPALDPAPTPEPEPTSESGSQPSDEADPSSGPDVDWNDLNDMIIAPPTDDPIGINFPDFEIPDLDGHYTFPPQISSPPLPTPELLPGYELGPDGPIWVGEGPDPLSLDQPSNQSSDKPSIIVSIEPLNISEPTISFSCVEPIPQVGFNSCLGGCNHTAAEIAEHEVYLQNFAEEERKYHECLENQATQFITPDPPAEPVHGIFPDVSEIPSSDDFTPDEAEDASGRRPRPGMSHPLIPYPPPENFTGPFPVDTISTPTGLNTSLVPATNVTELQPYQNKTLGELVSQILEDPDTLGPAPVDDDNDAAASAVPSSDSNFPEESSFPDLLPVPSNSSEDIPSPEPSNPLQDAVDAAEEGVTVPEAPVAVDPNALKSAADFLPWLMGPGPVITMGPDGKEE